ncbi:MAG: hypothetical protein JXR76_08775 [Deltaproteobacteria bacterium]|nr:hypothetical protein [Deltaproteobacteria bacterium]
MNSLLLNKKNWITIVGIWVLLWQAGCESSDEDGAGTLNVTIWGEAYIEQGIPAAEFADGYAITYEKFLVNVRNISAATADGAIGIRDAASKIWDVTKVGPTDIVSAQVDAASYTHTAYTIAPANAASLAGNADAADVAMMKQNGYSIFVQALATNGTITKHFAWGFNSATRFDPCHSLGVVTSDGEASIQITIHGDHLFYDSAQSTDPALRFTDLALADANSDNEITREELLAYSITALQYYTVGNMDITNMWDYLSYMVKTVGHIDGENHCEMQ